MRRLARPAAAAGVLRRPAAQARVRAPRQLSPEEAEEKLRKGQSVEASLLRPGVLVRGESHLRGKGGVHCRTEEVLKWSSENPNTIFRAHICQRECDQKRDNVDLCHVRHLKLLLDGHHSTWEENLVVEMPMAGLREDQAAWEARNKEKEKEKKKDRKSSSSREARKKKKKKKKEKKRKRREEEADAPARGERARGSKQGEKSGEATQPQNWGKDSGKEEGQRFLRWRGNGSPIQDPEEAKRALKKTKEETSSSTSETSGTSSDDEVGENLLVDRSKVYRISQISPGLLASTALEEMKPHLSQAMGNMWAEDDKELPPLLSQCNRSFMTGRLSVHTLCHVGDLLVLARPAEALDCIVQRLKPIELTAPGNSWQSSQTLELVPHQDPQLSSRQEQQLARREHRADHDWRGQEKTQPPKGAPKGGGKGKDKGKDKKGKDKTKEGDAKKSS